MSTAQTAAAPPAVVPMTDEQKFFFDLKGWLLVPGVLTQNEIEACREHLRVCAEDRASLPAHLRQTYGGAVAELFDHPVLVGILNTILNGDVGEGYGYKADGHYIQRRKKGDKGIEPHGGGFNATPLFGYRCANRAIYSGLTRVVWELNPVEHGKGGTLLMSGTHKNNFDIPAHHLKIDSPLFETYSCPAGSLLLFTENLCHSGALWTSDTPRLAVFNCYAHHMTQYHKGNWDPAVVGAMPRKRQTLFRGVWHADFSKSPTKINDWYGEDNRAY